MKVSHNTIQTNGVNLHVVSAGPEVGPLMIFLHGFPEFWMGWKNQIEYFANLGYRVLVPDQRGYNESDKPRAVSSYCIDELAKDIVGLIDHAGQKQAVIVGHDWGAAVAWWIAIKYSERVKKLVILNVPHPLVMQKNLKSNFSQLKKSWYIFFFQIPKLPEWYLSKRNARKLGGALLTSSLPGTFTKEDLKEYTKAWNQKGAVSSMVNWYRAALRKPPQPVSNQTVKMPTLVLWGEQDKFLGREMASESLKYCSQGKLKLLPEATHWVQHEKPAQVNAAIEAFLK